MPATYDSIATTTLASATSFIQFSSIPATFTDLRLVLVGRNAPGFLNSYFTIRFNNDTAGNYSETYLLGYGTANNSSRDINNSWITLGGLNGIDDVLSSSFTMDIFNYTASTNKTVLGTAAVDRNSSSAGHVGLNAGLWRNSAAINNIRLQTSGGNFATGTTATLYGILRA